MKTIDATRLSRFRTAVLTAIIVAAGVFLTACEEAGADGGGSDEPDGSGSSGYEVGDTGPAGGIVFYIDENDEHDGWTYLEVWTADENDGDFFFQWKTANTATNGTETGIGTGYTNTYDHMTGSEHPAAAAARAASHGSKNDWFLPSKDEMLAVWDNLVDDGSGKNNGTGSFSSSSLTAYWTSSQSSTTQATAQYFNNGTSSDVQGKTTSSARRVRVIRRF